MKEIPLSKGLAALVDDTDYEMVGQHSWSAHPARHGYYARCHMPSGQHVYMHRFILGLEDPAVKVDHKDGNGLNNCRSNLRVATPSQNGANRHRQIRARKYKGTVWDKKFQKWFGQIGRSGSKFLGYFDTEEEAAKAYDWAALRQWGEFATLNFPELKDFYLTSPQPLASARLRPRRKRAGSSKYRGVFWSNRRQWWMINLRVGRKVIQRSGFRSEEAAARKHDEEVIRLGLDRRLLNFPSD